MSLHEVCCMYRKWAAQYFYAGDMETAKQCFLAYKELAAAGYAK